MILYDPDEFSQMPTPVPELYRAPMVVRNIVGFFVEGVDAGGITGVITAAPGNLNPAAPAIAADASFLRSVALVR
jgi:hypothetical protein